MAQAFSLHAGAAESFNRRANDILQRVAEASRDARRAVPQPRVGSAAHVPVVAVIQPTDVIGDVVGRAEDIEGRLVELTFEVGGKVMVLGTEGCSAADDLKAVVLSRRELGGACSGRFVESVIVEWLKQRLAGGHERTWVEFFLEHLSAAVKDLPFRVPLEGIMIETPFDIGPYRVGYLTDADVGELAAKVPEPHRNAALEKYKKHYQGKVCVCGTVTAEPSRVVERALEAAEDVVRALRFVHPGAFELLIRCDVGVYGRVLMPSWHVILGHGQAARASAGTDELAPPFEVRRGDLEVLDQLGLAAVSAYLNSKEPSQLQQRAWSALGVFTRGIELGSWKDKVINGLVAAETLLLKNETEPIQQSLGLRMARMLGENLEDRKTLKANVQFAYQARSRFMHHGRDMFAKEDREKLNAALRACHLVILNCLSTKNADTVEALVALLEDELLK